MVSFGLALVLPSIMPGPSSLVRSTVLLSSMCGIVRVGPRFNNKVESVGIVHAGLNLFSSLLFINFVVEKLDKSLECSSKPSFSKYLWFLAVPCTQAMRLGLVSSSSLLFLSTSKVDIRFPSLSFR